MQKALLVVRAEIPDPADRAAFDTWYQTEHLVDALEAFQAERAWRCWSKTEPAVHYAFYQLDNVAAAEAVLKSSGIRPLIAEFDRVWGSRATRTRDILDVMQALPN